MVAAANTVEVDNTPASISASLIFFIVAPSVTEKILLSTLIYEKE